LPGRGTSSGSRIFRSKPARRDACDPEEDRGELTLAGKATAMRDVHERKVPIREESPCHVHSSVADVLMWRKARRLPEHLGEIVRAQPGDFGKRTDRKVAFERLFDVFADSTRACRSESAARA
jgi:hypothetical protein